MFDSFHPYILGHGVMVTHVTLDDTLRVRIPLSQLFIYVMSKGKKFNTPKRFWKNMRKKTKRPSYSVQSWRKTSPHVFGQRHKKFKWYYRNKKWFKEFDGERLSHQKMNNYELWFWD